MPAPAPKSVALTAFLAALPANLCGPAAADPHAQRSRRSAAASSRIALGADRARARRVFESLEARGVVADWREPNVDAPGAGAALQQFRGRAARAGLASCAGRIA